MMTKEQYLGKVTELVNKANSKGLKLIFNPEQFEPDHLDCTWLGGNIATIETPYAGYVLTIDAIGDVIATLYDEYNNEIAYSKDKQNYGRFYEDMHDYIKDDDELYELLESDRLVLDYNNWVEFDLLHEREDKSICTYDFIDWGIITDNVCDSNNILDAIEEVIDRYDDEISDWIRYEINEEKGE